jgi:CRP/FNR family transcriptional regulator, cyclic AMP receptor protein
MYNLYMPPMKSSLPSCLSEFNSIWNPILEAFIVQIIHKDDNRHSLEGSLRVALLNQISSTMIDPSILKKYGVKELSFQKDEMIFAEGEEALNYFQIKTGSIKMITNSPEGQEFIQGIFKADDSFGEPPLFCSFPYPSFAIVLEPSIIYKLSKDNFFTLLRENFEIHLHMDTVLCQRLRYKSMVLTEISFHNPEHRIQSLLTYLKNESNKEIKNRPPMIRNKHEYVVPFTRQQLADMSGLRVETVIRTIKKMEGDGKLKIEGRKIKL